MPADEVPGLGQGAQDYPINEYRRCSEGAEYEECVSWFEELGGQEGGYADSDGCAKWWTEHVSEVVPGDA